MEKITLESSGGGHLLLGITQDPTEVTNSQNSYRIITEKNGTSRIGRVIECVKDGVWTPVPLDTVLGLASSLLQSHKTAFDNELLDTNEVFYLIVLESKEGNPYDGIESPMDEIDKIINAKNPQIEEDVFIKNYAFFFLHHYPQMVERDPEYPEKYAAAMRRWRETIAPHAVAVDVVEKTSTGVNILFTLPPRVSTSEVFDPHVGARIEEITYEAAFRGQTNPADAERYVERKFSEKLHPISDEELRKQNQAAILALDDIRERYNIPRWIPKPQEAQDTSGADQQSVSEASSGFGDDAMGSFDD